MSMLLKMAKAAAGVGSGSMTADEYWDRYKSPASKERAIDEMRAALLAIREPSEAMMRATQDSNGYVYPEDFTAMIDAILAGDA